MNTDGTAPGLHEILDRHVGNGPLPGAVGLLARGDRTELAAVGAQGAGGPPMSRDSIFRWASITKPVTAAAVMILVQDGRLALDDPAARWLPELARPSVVRTPASPLTDVVPAARPITVFDLLTSTAGYGFAADSGLPAVQRLAGVQRGGRLPRELPPPDTWMAELAEVPMLAQPGQAFLYDTCSSLQGVLVARASGQPLPGFLAERIFGPLGMADAGFEVPQAKRDRMTSYYRRDADGGLELLDGPDGQWTTRPDFPAGNGGLAGSAADWLAFARMLLAGGVAADGRRVLTEESVAAMTTDHTAPAQRELGAMFLDGQGWGFGGCVDIAVRDPWNVPGRYGWVGATGTSAHVIPSTGLIAILLTQVAVDSPLPSPWLPDFWTYTTKARV